MTYKLTTDRELLVSKLSKAFKFVPSKQIIPAWENFRLSIKGNVMEILASDGAMQIKMFCPVDSKADFEVCLPAGLLLKTISLFKENSVSISMKTEKRVELKSGKSRYIIALDCFPDGFGVMTFHTIVSEINMSQFMLKMALKSTQSFANPDHPIDGFKAINIAEKGNKMVFIGAEKVLICRMGIPPISINSWEPINISPEISKKVVSLLSDKGEISIVHTRDKVRFFTDSNSPDHFEITSVVSNVKFPNAEKLFSGRPEDSIVFNTLEVKDAIRRLSLYGTIGSEPEVHITNAENSQELKLTSQDNVTGKSGEEFISIINPSGVVINKKFNNETIIKLLSEIEAAETSIYFVSGDDKGPSFLIPKVNTPEEDIYSFLISSVV